MCIKSPLLKNKQMLKDVIQFFEFKYGRVFMVTYWVDHSLSQGVFPNRTLSKPCKEYDMDGVLIYGHGVP